jgi:pectinesterase
MLDDKNEPLTTFRTETLLILGSNITLSNLTIQNASGFSKEIGQAVALAILGDNARVINCTLSAFQDTLFLGPFPKDLQERYKNMLGAKWLRNIDFYSTFENTTIIGNVDFIFGSGIALFYECNIICNGNGYIFAPSHDLTKPYGFITYKTTITSRDNNFNVILARPWRDYGSIFLIDTTYNLTFKKEIFDSWNNKETRFYLDPYLDSPLSKKITSSELDEIKEFILKHFQLKLK